jgi:hypothetical protein
MSLAEERPALHLPNKPMEKTISTFKGSLIIPLLILALFIIALPVPAFSAGPETFLVHLKTGIKKDDAQICVAYNVIWAALEEGYTVKVLVDADAINTFKIGWFGKDDIEKFQIPETLRKALADQFKVSLGKVPRTYGDFLILLHDRGAEFFINSGFLIVSKIGTPEDLLGKVSAKFFTPVTLREMVRMRADAEHYMAY